MDAYIFFYIYFNFKVYDKGESSLDSMDSESSGNFRINVTVELGQILTRKLAYTVYVPFYFLLGKFFVFMYLFFV